MKRPRGAPGGGTQVAFGGTWRALFLPCMHALPVTPQRGFKAADGTVPLLDVSTSESSSFPKLRLPAQVPSQDGLKPDLRGRPSWFPEHLAMGVRGPKWTRAVRAAHHGLGGGGNKDEGPRSGNPRVGLGILKRSAGDCKVHAGLRTPALLRAKRQVRRPPTVVETGEGTLQRGARPSSGLSSSSSFYR